MQYFIVFLAFAAFSGGAIADTQSDLKKASLDLWKLGNSFDFDIAAKNVDSVQKRWIANGEKLELVASRPSPSNQQEVDDLKKDVGEIYTEVRRCGLLFPFSTLKATDPDSQIKEIIGRYMKLEDDLGKIYVSIGWTPVTPPPVVPVDVWYWGNYAFKVLETDGQAVTVKYSVAAEACAGIKIPGTGTWAPPVFETLRQSFRAMKDPVRNPVFARAISEARLWTSDAGQAAGSHVILNMKIENREESLDSVPQSVVCSAKIVPAGGSRR